MNHNMPMTNHSMPMMNHSMPMMNHSMSMMNHSMPMMNHSMPMMNHSMSMMNHSMPMMNHSMSMMNHSHGSTMMDHSGHHGNAATSMSPGGHGGHGIVGSGDGSLHDMMGMQMYFTTNWNGTTVLFQDWILNDVWQLVLSCIFLGVLAALYEGLKVYREHLLVTYNTNNAYIASSNGIKGEGSQEVITEQPEKNVSSRICSWIHAVQTFLHMVQVTVSYFLMLVFMTYNAWLCLSVILGAGLGYFLFGWKRAVINDSNEHCH